jgi:hypothetical protein
MESLWLSLVEVIINSKKGENMKEEKVLQIWEEGNRETIEKLHDILLQTEGVYRIIKRRPENLERYFKTHSEQDGFSFHPIRYEWDGKVWILEKLNFIH